MNLGSQNARFERLEDYFSVSLDCTREVDFSVGAQIVVVCARRAGVLERWEDQVVHPAPGDNFAVGLIDPRKGDWFEVRELSVFVGTLP
ncbi:MAG: hypothetical protein DME00_26905 [Candidatus Rokuibacteriota bacterium]|nr:MAG: hypothetical protein DME00_26905 [Candidatus Rokubacteria bacterium]